MKRRKFLTLTGATGAWLAHHAAPGEERAEIRGLSQASPRARGLSPDFSVLDHDGLIAGRSLDDLIARYRHDLFDDFLPFMEAHIIDHEYGGFMTDADRRGKLLTTNKRSRYEGRGMWVYAHLYRTLAPEEKYLEVARKSAAFLLRADPGASALWPNALSREGAPMKDEGMLIAGKRYPSGTEVYDDMFIAEGFTAYAHASGQEEFIARAIQILKKCEGMYDAVDYAPTAPLVYMGGEEAPLLPGCRLLGVWMVMLRLATQLLAIEDDAYVRGVADRCVEAIMKRHRNMEFDLLNEVLNHDFSLPDNRYAQLAYTGHGIETLWMVLDEALRRKDRALFDEAANLFRRHLEVSWDAVYQGWFRGCRHVNDHQWILDKAAWIQQEALVGLMMIVEHTGADWAKAWLRKGYTYVIEHFPLERHGYPLWDVYPDRRVTFVEDYNRVEHFHHPRHLILNLEALLRIKERDGAVSGVFG